MKIDGALLVRQIEAYLASNGKEKQEFFEATGVNSANLSQWRSGVHEPSQSKIDAIVEFTGMPIDALMYGRPAGADDDSLKTAQAALFGGLYGRLSEQEMDDLWADAQEFAQFKATQMIRGKGNK